MTIIQAILVGASGPHTGYIIKPADETRSGGVADDSDLFTSLRASTLYEVRAALYISGNGAATHVRLFTTASVAHAAIRTSQMNGAIADGWPQASTNTQMVRFLDTTHFNNDQLVPAFVTPDIIVFLGMIKTSSACTLSLQWGHTAGSPTETVHAGSWLFAREMEEA